MIHIRVSGIKKLIKKEVRIMAKNIEKQKEDDGLEIQLITSELATDGVCGPDTCPWVGCEVS